MTVPASSSRISYSGNGSTTSFPFAFGVTDDDELIVQVDGIATTAFTVTCPANNCLSGGTVVMETAPDSGSTLTILRDIDITQESDFVEGSPDLAQTFEEQLDKQTMILQQLQEQIGRAPKIDAGSPYGGMSYTLPDPVPGNVIGWNTAGSDLTNYDNSGGAAVADSPIIVVDTIAELRNTIPTDGKLCNVIGYYGPGDGGGGPMRRGVTGAAAGTYVDDGGSVIVPTGGDGSAAWIFRDPQSMPFIDWWGPNVTPGTTDMSTPLAKALAYSKTAYLYSKRYLITDITVATNSDINGVGHNTEIYITNTVTAAIKLNGVRIKFRNMTVVGASSSCLAMKTIGASQYTQFHNVLFQNLLVAVDVLNGFYWSKFLNVEFRDCGRGVKATVTAFTLNAVSFVNTVFFHTAATSDTFAVDVTNSDGIAFVGCDMQNYGPKLTDCNDVEISGGYWEAYVQPVLTAINTRLHIAGIYPPSATKWSIDDDSYQKSTGLLPPTSNYPGLAPANVNGKNIFPNADCNTTASYALVTNLISGTAPSKSINANGNLQIDMTAAGFAGFRINPPLSGCAAYLKVRALNGSFGVRFYSSGTSIEQSNLVLTSGSDWNYLRLHTRITGDDIIYLAVQNNGTVAGTFSLEIDFVYIVPDYCCITRPPLSDSTARQIAGQFLTVDAGRTSVTGGGNAVVYTFSSTAYGTYLVSSYATNRASSAQKSISYVIVHSGSVMTVISLTATLSAHSATGLDLVLANSGGTSDFTTEIVRLSS